MAALWKVYFFGRPAFNGVSVARMIFSVLISRPLISETPIRSKSLFFISKPAFRQAFFTCAMTAYSGSGMVKLSRICLIFLIFGASGAFSAGLMAGFTTGLGTAVLANVAGRFFVAGGGFFSTT